MQLLGLQLSISMNIAISSEISILGKCTCQAQKRKNGPWSYFQVISYCCSPIGTLPNIIIDMLHELLGRSHRLSPVQQRFQALLLPSPFLLGLQTTVYHPNSSNTGPLIVKGIKKHNLISLRLRRWVSILWVMFLCPHEISTPICLSGVPRNSKRWLCSGGFQHIISRFR